MTTSVPLIARLLLAAGCVALTQLPVWQAERRTNADAIRAAQFDVSQLPIRLGHWTGAVTEMDERLIRHVGALSVVSRSYEEGLGRRAMVHLASFSTAEMSLPHPPPLCYRNAGWQIAGERWEGRDTGTPHRLMLVEREGNRAVISYWYQLGNEAASTRGELRKELQKLRWHNKRWPPLVKVLVHVPVETTDTDAQSTANELSAEIFDWVAKNS